MSRPSCVALAAVAVLLSAVVSRVQGAVFNCVGGSVYAVAHPDDDLLFQSPTLLDDIDSGECITSIFLTSGDSGAGGSYAQSRETGNQAAYSQMFGVDNLWTEFYATFGGQPVLVRTLVAKPQHQAVFFRLPDGGWDTGGFPSTGYQTLRGLYFGTISSITNQPGDATYTLATLKQAVSQILAARQPARVRTLDYLSDFDGGDHDDHLTTGRLIKGLVGSASVSGFMGYPVQNLPPTLSTTSTAFQRKSAALFTYAPYDPAMCQSLSACSGRGESSWLQREYAVTPTLATKSSSGAPQTPVTLPSGTNIAPLAVASSSSDEGSSVPSAAIDGVVSGYPRNETAEWASDHQGAGAWLRLTWSEPVSVFAVVLYDRPNENDWLKAGTLAFSDGSSVGFTNPVNDGSATVIQLSRTYTTTSLLLTVTQVSSATVSVGISELQVYGTLGATASSTSSAPASTSTGSVSGNLARNATASASSWGVATDQTPDKAIDGVVNGYKPDGTGDYTREWATDHEGAGAYLALQWDSPVTANQIVLFDRPNLDDAVTSATISFSDGSNVAVSALNNAGEATTLSFAAKTFSSLVFTVDSVSNTTSNIGLAELQVFFASGSTATASATSASPSSTATASSIPASSSSTAATSSAVAPSSTAAQPQPTGSPSLNLARNATASASTWSDATSQTPDKAVDGVVSGYKEDGSGDYTKEWASDHEGAGATFALSWSSPVTATRFVLYDRPNLNDQITSAYIQFSDQSTVTVPTLANDGSATAVDFAEKTFSSAILYITGASNTTSNIGLAEIQVFYVAANRLAASSTTASAIDSSAASSSLITSTSSGTAAASYSSAPLPGSSAAPTSGASGSASSAAATSGAQSSSSPRVTSASSSTEASSSSVLPASASTSSRTTITFASAASTASSIAVTSASDSSRDVTSSVAPSGSSSSVSLAASSTPSSTSASATPAAPSATGLVNFARQVQAVSTSSSNSGTGQTANKAIDGVISGYPSNFSAEWATNGQGAGAWLQLTWPSPVTLNQVALFDRPNTNDWITNATLRFSDGSVVSTGALVNSGAGAYVNFTARDTTSLRFTVVSVSSSTSNAGLAEIQVFNNPAARIPAPSSASSPAVASSTRAVTTGTSSAVTAGQASTTSVSTAPATASASSASAVSGSAVSSSPAPRTSPSSTFSSSAPFT